MQRALGITSRSMISLALASLLIIGLLPPPTSALASSEQSSGQRNYAPPSERSRRPSQSADEPIPAADPDQYPSAPTGKPEEVLEGLDEVVSKREESARAFRSPGEPVHTVEVFPGPVHFQDEAGKWVPIDASVAEAPGGYTNAANFFTLFFPNELAGDNAIEFSHPQGQISTQLVGAAASAAHVTESSITYPELLPGTDFVYTLTPGGYKEDVVLKDPQAAGDITYHVTAPGLSLTSDETGRILIMNGETLVGELSPPFAEDANYDESVGHGARSFDVAQKLTQTEPDSYEIAVSVAPEWLHAPERVFPVVIDPSFTSNQDPTLVARRKDNYARSGTPAMNYDQYSPTLEAGAYNAAATDQSEALLTFNILTSVRPFGHFIYDAAFKIYAYDSYDATARTTQLKRNLAYWDAATLSWNNRPGLDPTVWAEHTGCGKPSCEQWHSYSIKDLVQLWLDTTGCPNPEGDDCNHGVRLSAPGPHPSWKKYRSMDYPSDATKPQMIVYVNDIPQPTIDNTALGSFIETDTPALKANIPADLNGDEVVVRYEVATNTNFTSVVYDSTWIERTTTHVVPPGFLQDGKTYYWRVRAADICEPNFVDPDVAGDPRDPITPVCNDLDRNHFATPDPDPQNGDPITGLVSPVSSSFSIGLKRRGTDPRWAMWDLPMGNDMDLAVDLANGNLNLDVPLDSLATPAGPLDLALVYNSHSGSGGAADGSQARGLSPGWDLSAGPSPSSQQLPARLVELKAGTVVYAVEVVYRSARRDVFAKTGLNTYGQFGPGAGTIRFTGGLAAGNGPGDYILHTHDGGVFTFEVDGTLKKARPRTASFTEPAFTYQYSGARLTKVTDPLGRDITFTYQDVGNGSPLRLSSINAWGGRTWTLEVDPSFDRLLTAITNPDGDRLEFGYESLGEHPPYVPKLISVKDGFATETAGPAATIAYSDLRGKMRATVVRAPGAGNPTTFDYDFGPGSSPAPLALSTKVTDPRGVATTGVATDFQTQTYFNYGGLPIKTLGPILASGERAVVYRGWDEHANLKCVRTSAANAALDPGTAFACGDGDGLQTEFTYQEHRPFLVTKVVGSAPGDGRQSERLVKSYDYDEGFQGLQAQYFDNKTFSGLPKAVGITGTVSSPWGPSSGPAELGGQADDFSVRLFGKLQVSHASNRARPYEFEVTGEDGLRLIIGSELLVECGPHLKPAVNCSTPLVKEMHLRSKPYPIILEHYEETGSSSFQVRWRERGGTWQTISGASLIPATNALTSAKIGTQAGAGALSTTSYSYVSDTAKLKSLPTQERLDGGSATPGTVAQVVDYSYDTYGRVVSETDATGDPITYRYGSSAANTDDAFEYCLEEIVDRLALQTEFECNDAGDIVDEWVHVSPSDVRHTRMTYSSLGRPLSIESPDGGLTEMAYNDAGWLKQRKVKVSVALNRFWNYDYDSRGWVEKETLPDPDYTGPAARPDVEHEYDDVGNELEMTDERDESWTRTYDARNLRVSRTDPENNTWSYSYDVAGHLVDRTDPKGIKILRDYDLLSRVVSRRLKGAGIALAPKSWTYDERGLVATETDPDDEVDDEPFRFSYDAAGRVLSESAPVMPNGGAAVRRYFYNDRGLTTKTTDFIGFETFYSYDAMGSLKKVTMPHSAPNETNYDYNKAGELTHVSTPRATGLPVTSDYDYDAMGRLESKTDGENNTTTFTYDLAGDSTQVVEPRGVTIVNTHDGLGRLVQRNAAGQGPNQIEDYGYDPAGNLTFANNAKGTVSFSYDGASRIASSIPSVGAPTTYSYDEHRLQARTDAAGTSTYGYNDWGRLESMQAPFAGTTTFAYTAAGRLLRRDDANGLAHDYTYDDAGRLTSEDVTRTGETVAYFQMGYDLNSRVKARNLEIENSLDNGAWTYHYDPAGRLTKATDPSATDHVYCYDSAGNRVAETKTGLVAGTRQSITTVTEFDRASRPTRSETSLPYEGDPLCPHTVDEPELVTTYEHDEVGNLTAMASPGLAWNYSYDGFSRMAKAELELSANPPAPGNPIDLDYDYDALDRTIRKTKTEYLTGTKTKLATETYSYAGAGDELVRSRLVVDGLANTKITTRAYVHAMGQPLMVEKTLETLGPVANPQVSLRFLGVGPHGDVNYLTDADMNVVASFTYDPWGKVRSSMGEKTGLGYQADPTDSDTGLVDMGARNYAPWLGRFTTNDPVKGSTTDPLSINPYIYGADDPVSNTDPTGMATCDSNGACRADDQHRVRYVPSRSDKHQAAHQLSPNVLAVNSVGADPHFVVRLGTFTIVGLNQPRPAVESGGSSRLARAILGFLPLGGDAFDLFDCFGGEGLACLAAVPILGWGADAARAGRALGAVDEVVGATRGVGSLADDALVVRGGTNTAERLAAGSEWIDDTGQIHNLSVNSGTGVSLLDLLLGIPHKQVGVTTVGEIRAIGGQIVRDPIAGNPFHCLVSCVTPDALSRLLTPTIRNPAL